MKPVVHHRSFALLATTLSLILAAGYLSPLLAQEAPLFSQDLTLKETTTSTGGMGDGATLTSTNYFSRNAMRRSAPDGNDTIIKVDEGLIITVNHKKKTYSSVSVKELDQTMEKAAAEMAKTKEQMEAVRKMMGQMIDGFTVTKIGPGEPIAGYQTEKYGVKGMMEMEIWAAPALKVPGLYYDALKLSARPNPMFDMGKMYEEFKKIDGMTLKTVTSLKMMNMDMQTTTVVTSVEKSPIPRSVFEIPAGYKQVPPELLR